MSENKFCIYCGTPLESGWAFCKECGKKIKKEVVPHQEELVIEVENKEEIVETNENIEEIILEEPITEEMIYNHNRNHLADLYNKIAKRNSNGMFQIFLVVFLVIVGLLALNIWAIPGVLIIICGILALSMIITNKSYKKTVDILSAGTSKIEIEENHFIIETNAESIYERSIINYEDVVNIEENDAIIVFGTKLNRVYVVDKQVLKEKLSMFRNNLLKNAKIYNGHQIKKEQIEQGKYDYYPETDYTISITKAKEKSLFYNSIVIFSLIVLFVIGVYIDNLMTLLLFVPIGIINLLYINKLNKKTQGKFKIVGEKVLTIIFTIASGLFGLLSLLIIL